MTVPLGLAGVIRSRPSIRSALSDMPTRSQCPEGRPPSSICGGRPMPLSWHRSAPPVTKQSGQRKAVDMRQACSPRLRNAVFKWATSSLYCDSRSRKQYDALRAPGHLHARPLRGLADRLLSVLIALAETQRIFDRTRRDGTFNKRTLVVGSA